jgi:hypothetical protein
MTMHPKALLHRHRPRRQRPRPEEKNSEVRSSASLFRARTTAMSLSFVSRCFFWLAFFWCVCVCVCVRVCARARALLAETRHSRHLPLHTVRMVTAGEEDESDDDGEGNDFAAVSGLSARTTSGQHPSPHYSAHPRASYDSPACATFTRSHVLVDLLPHSQPSTCT